MVASPIQGVLGSLWRVAVAGLSDGDLLGRFLTNRDEAAFRELMRRHGPMVLGVCHRILKNHADAEDAFQATFLVLARKGISVKPRAMVGHWLYGVARKAALKTQAMNNKRRRKEREAATSRSSNLPKEEQVELQDVLDEELGCLPEKYRSVLVLCELEGRLVKNVATQLGLPQGTVASRLSRGRALLADRLRRRGVVFSSAGLGALISGAMVEAGVPPTLMGFTVKAALAMAGGEAATTSLVTAEVLAITKGVLQTMWMTKLKVWGLVVLGLMGISMAGASILSPNLAAPPMPRETVPLSRPELAPEERKQPEKLQDRPKPEVIIAWEKAGAEFGWFWVGNFGFPQWRSGRNEPGSLDIPAFRFKKFPTGKLHSLPLPDVPFGLWLQGSKATNADLKELVCLKKLQTLSLKGTKVTDAGLKELAYLPQLQKLYLGFTKVTDAGLKELVVLKQLKTLDLRQTKITDFGMKELVELEQLQEVFLGFNNNITDAALKELANLDHLQFLGLWGTKVTDAGMKELAELKQLQSLGLMDTQVTDAGLKELAGLTNLQELNLGQTQVTDAAQQQLARFKRLQWLNLAGTKITDDSLKTLGRLKQLRKLDLGQTQITDSGLKKLVGLKQLLLLDLRKTRVTEEGVRELEKALPQINISY